MKVICVFPMFPVEKYHKNIPDIITKCKIKIFPKLCLLGAINPEIRFSNIKYKYVETNKVLEGEPKGEGILGCLEGIKDIDYAIICDGSGKIPYENIIGIFQELMSDSNVHCVMGNRINNKAISPPRYLIERFEVFVFKKYFNYTREIPDGQCGLWGYQKGEINFNGNKKEIKLTARSYEIELDLLSEVLEKNLNFLFVDVELPPQKEIDNKEFKKEDSLVKMRFFLNKYPKLSADIPKRIVEFEKKEVNKELEKYWKEYKDGLIELL